MFTFVAELLSGGLLVYLVYYIFLVPPKYPTNIPAIPFWVALLPFFQDVDQSDIFRKYIQQPLRTHGAVKLFFGAQWNILVHRPSYLAEMFKDEDLYQKSGNYKKIPHSVLSELLGDNIISSHGEIWRNYQSVIKPGLQRRFEADKIASNAELLCRLLREAQVRGGKRGVAVQELLQRYSVANCSEVILQTNLEVRLHPSIYMAAAFSQQANIPMTSPAAKLGQDAHQHSSNLGQARNLQARLYELPRVGPASVADPHKSPRIGKPLQAGVEACAGAKPRTHTPATPNHVFARTRTENAKRRRVWFVD